MCLDAKEHCMFKKIRNFYLKKVRKMSSMDIKISDWRKKGITIGDRCHIYSNLPTTRDCFLLSIGNDVTISGGCVFLLHDSSIGQLTNGKYTDLLGRIIIGNECFIGHSSVLLPGIELADGTVVGAGSVVTKSFKEKNVIIAGNPAKIIGRTDDFLARYLDKGFNLDGMSQAGIEALVRKNIEKLIEK